MATREKDLLGRVQTPEDQDRTRRREEDEEDHSDLLGRVQDPDAGEPATSPEEPETDRELDFPRAPEIPERLKPTPEERVAESRRGLLESLGGGAGPRAGLRRHVEISARGAPAARSSTDIVGRGLERRGPPEPPEEEEEGPPPTREELVRGLQGEGARRSSTEVAPDPYRLGGAPAQLRVEGASAIEGAEPGEMVEKYREVQRQVDEARARRDYREEEGLLSIEGLPFRGEEGIEAEGLIADRLEEGIGFSFKALGGVLRRVGEETGSEDLVREGELLEKGGEIRETEALSAPVLRDVSEIRTDQGPQAFVQDVTDFVLGSTAQGVGTTFGPIAGALAGGTVGGPGGAVLGALGPSYALGRQEIKDALVEEGIPEDEADDIADEMGVPMAFLEAIVPAQVGKGFTQPVRREIARRVARRAAQIAAAGTAESFTEGSQRLLSDVTVAQELERPMNWGRTLGGMAREGSAAFFPGAFFGAAGVARGAARRRADVGRYRQALEERGRARREGGGIPGTVGPDLEEVSTEEPEGPTVTQEAETGEVETAPEVEPQTSTDEGGSTEGSETLLDRARRRVADAIDPDRAEELEQAREEAETDDLTGLPNRRGEQRQREELERRAPRNGNTVELRADLDNFKAINDNLGHDAGDEALQVVAEALQDATREGDAVVARTGGDEFRIHLNVRETDNPDAIARRIKGQVDAALTDAGYGQVGDTEIGLSVGVGEEGLQQAKEEGPSEGIEGRQRREEQAEDGPLAEIEEVLQVEGGEVVGRQYRVRQPDGETEVFDTVEEAEEAAEGRLEERQEVEPREATELEGEGVNAPLDPETEGIPDWMPEGARYVRSTKTPEGVAKRVWEFPVEHIGVDPERFQFKSEGIGERGVSGKFDQEGLRFDEDLQGVIQVWRDPETGKVWVVNGHHRLDLAKRDPGASHVTVRFLRGENAGEARRTGALTNIAEGQGTPLDAAKLFREEDITREDLQDFNIPLTEHVADLGLALKDLHQSIFRAVATGKFPARRAAIVGRAGLSEDQQVALWEQLQKMEEGSQRRLTNRALEELIRQVQAAGTRTTKEQTLFGDEVFEESLFTQRAVISEYVKSQLSQDRKIMSFLNRQGRAERIEETGAGEIREERAQEIEEEAGTFEAHYDALSTRAGPVSDILNEAAEELAENPGEEDAIKRRALERIKSTLEQEIQNTERGGETVRGRDRASAPDDAADAFTGESEGGGRQQLRPPDPDNIDTRYTVGGVVFDTSEGMGSVPFNRNVNQLGFTIFLRPSEFLEMAGGRPGGKVFDSRVEAMVNAIEAGETVGPPFLDMFQPGAVRQEVFSDEVREISNWEVQGHEGRHRMAALQELLGDRPIPVHVFMRGNYDARSLTEEMLSELREEIETQLPDETTQIDRPVEIIWQGTRYRIRDDDFTREASVDPGSPIDGLVSGGMGSAFTDPRQEGMFPEIEAERERVEQPELGDLGDTQGPQGLSESVIQAKKTVKRLSRKIETDDITEAELRRFRQATRVLKRHRAKTGDEVRLDTKQQKLRESGERESPTERQRGLFGPENGFTDDQRNSFDGLYERWQASVAGAAGIYRDVRRWLNDQVGKVPFVSADSETYIPEFTLEEADPRYRERPGLPEDYAPDEVQEQIDAAKGLPEEHWWDGLAEALKSLVTGFQKRRMEHLPVRGVDQRREFAFAREKLLQMEKQAANGVQEAVERLADITEHMSKEDYDLFSIYMVLSDLQHTPENHPLPFGFEDTEQVKESLAKVQSAVDQNAVVKEAIQRREKHIEQVRNRLIKALEALGDTEIRDILSRPDYFHHQVLAHARQKGIIDGVGESIEQPSPRTEGYLRKRVGTELPHNTDYLQAEGEVLAKMSSRAREAEILKEIGDHYDVSDQYKAQLKAAQEQAQSTQGELGFDFDFEIPTRARSLIEAGEEVTLREAIPEGYQVWQPKPGSRFWYAPTIPQSIAERLTEGLSEIEGVTEEDIHYVLARGQRNPEWLIPEELATQLDDMPINYAARSDVGKAAAALKGAQDAWKQWQLISPRRFARYNIRNITGDAEAVFVGNPSAFRKVPRAAKELRNLFRGGDFTPDLHDWYQRGGMQQLLQVQEMGEINKLDQFIEFAEKQRPSPTGDPAGFALDAVKRAWNTYWTKARSMTDYREAILRYAAYLDFLEQMRENPDGTPNYWGASFREEVMALPDIKDRAHKMQNELVGAYDDISPNGETMRDFLWPFWSFSEINFRRFKRIIQNAAHDEQLMGALGRKMFGQAALRMPYAAARLAGLTLKLHALWATTQAFNYAIFGDEEEELPEQITGRPHLILGKDPDTGEIRYFSRMGAWSELLEWWGLHESPQKAKDFLSGRKTLTEIATETFAWAPLNKMVGGAGPVWSYPTEFATGKRTWPKMFPVREQRQIRDRMEHLFQSLALGPEYRALVGKPTRNPYFSLETLQQLPYYTTKPNAGGYWDTQDRMYDFLNAIGETSRGTFMSERSNALYEFRRAVRYGDRNAAQKYLLKYAELTGVRVEEGQVKAVTDPKQLEAFQKTMRGVESSLENLRPLSRLTDEQKRGFLIHIATGMKPTEAMNEARQMAGTGVSDELRRKLENARDREEVRDWIRARQHYEELLSGEPIREREQRGRGLLPSWLGGGDEDG